MILRLVRSEKDLAIEGLNPDKHLEASGSRQQVDKLLLFCNLCVALNEERNSNSLRDHCFQQRRPIGVFVEVVRGEHDHLDACIPRSAKTRQGRFNVLRADDTARNLDD